MVKANRESEAGAMPDKKILTKMGKYNEELVKAGVMLAADGLHPSSKAARVRLSQGKLTVTDGPFAEAKEVIASFALIQVKSKEEAVQRVAEFLNICGGGEADIYQVYEASDFGPEIAKSEEALREKLHAHASRK